MPHQSAQSSIECAGRPAALNMAKDGDANFFAQAFFQRLLDLRAADRIAAFIASAFGQNDNTVASSSLSTGADIAANFFAPIFSWWIFGNQDPFCAGGQPGHQG